MPLLPHPIYGLMTDSSSAAYTRTVWLTNQSTNQMVTTTCDSSGQYLYDLANMNSYSNGDEITVALEGYAKSPYLLVQDAFEDSSVEAVELSGQRLNTATLTMNFKIGFGVSYDKARVEVWKKIQAILESDPPTYTDKDSNTATYDVLSAYPEITPTFPCLVVNPIEKDAKKLGTSKRPHRSFMATIDIDFFAKTRDSKGAIDIARDKVEKTLTNNWITSSVTVDTSEGSQRVDIQGLE